MKKPIGLLRLKKNLKTKDANNNKKTAVATKTNTRKTARKTPKKKEAEDAKTPRRRNPRACANSSCQTGLTNSAASLKRLPRCNRLREVSSF